MLFPSLFSLAIIKYHDSDQSHYGRVYLTCSSRRESIRAEEKMAGEWGMKLKDHILIHK